SSRIAWSMNRLRFPFFVTRSSNSTVALGSVMLRCSYARVDAFMRTIRMLHTTDADPQDPPCWGAVVARCACPHAVQPSQRYVRGRSVAVSRGGRRSAREAVADGLGTIR